MGKCIFLKRQNPEIVMLDPIQHPESSRISARQLLLSGFRVKARNDGSGYGDEFE
jgi:hypothetical protein